MFYNRSNLFEYNECIGRGMCSIFPTISSFQEVMLIIFRTMSFYVLKLEQLNVDCKIIKKNIAEGISNLISTTGYSDEQLLEIIIRSYNDLIRIKRNYAAICKKRNINCKDIKLALKLTPNMNLSDVLTLGHRLIAEKNKKMNSNQKCYSEILFVTIKSVSLSLVKLFDYNISDDESLDLILSGLNLFNYGTFQVNKAKTHISKLAKKDLKLWKMREKAQYDTFGTVSKTEVSLSTSPGKAILVSGSSLNDLDNLLSACEGEKIDIYTHGDLLIAHAFDNFKKFKNLKGHFGTSGDDCVLDFATFPGAIVLTRHATQNIEFLIRGRLFTTEDISPKGVVSIQNNDFSDVIKAANTAKGFSKGRNITPVTVGFDYENAENIFSDLWQKIDNVKQIFIFGMSNFSVDQSEYFEEFLKLMPKDCFAISFSYHCECENLLYFNIANNFPLQLKILDLFFEKIPHNSDKVTFFLTKCDSNTISIMISLKESGAQKIYLSNCPPTIINPAVMNQFIKLYAINPITNAKNDLKNILQ